MIGSNHPLLRLLLRSFVDDGYIFLLVGLAPSDIVIGESLSLKSGKLISDDYITANDLNFGFPNHQNGVSGQWVNVVREHNQQTKRVIGEQADFTFVLKSGLSEQ